MGQAAPRPVLRLRVEELPHLGDEIGPSPSIWPGGSRARPLSSISAESALALDQVLDLRRAGLALLGALDDGAGAAAAVGILQLRRILPDCPGYISARMPAARRSRHHLLVAAEAFRVAVHDEDDDGADGIGQSSLPRFFSAVIRRDTPMEKPVAGTVLAREALDQPVIAPAAADRAEATTWPFSLGTVEEKFGLVDGAGVVFEAADDGGVDADRDLHRSRRHLTSSAIYAQFVTRPRRSSS